VVDETGDTSFRVEWDANGRLKKAFDGDQQLSSNPLINKLMSSVTYAEQTGSPKVKFGAGRAAHRDRERRPRSDHA
jgi:hypothetical protein